MTFVNVFDTLYERPEQMHNGDFIILLFYNLWMLHIVSLWIACVCGSPEPLILFCYSWCNELAQIGVSNLPGKGKVNNDGVEVAAISYSINIL